MCESSRLEGRGRLPRSGEEIDTSFVTQDGETLSEPVRFRRGWMLCDGTGCGKGRQVAAKRIPEASRDQPVPSRSDPSALMALTR